MIEAERIVLKRVAWGDDARIGSGLERVVAHVLSSKAMGLRRHLSIAETSPRLGVQSLSYRLPPMEQHREGVFLRGGAECTV